MNVLIFLPRAFTIGETFIQSQFLYQKKHKITGLCHKRQDNGIQVNNKIYRVSAVPVNFLDRVLSFFRRKIFGLYDQSFSVFTEKQIIKIINEENIEAVHANYGSNAIRFIPLKKKTGIKLIAHFHGIDASKELKNKHYSQNLKRLFKFADKIIVVSDDMKGRLIPYFKQEHLHKLSVIPYGVNLDNVIQTNAEKSAGETIKLLHVGRLTPKKGVLDLVKVYKKLQNRTEKKIHLDIVGDGSDYPAIKSYIESEQIENISLRGALQHRKAIEFMKRADILILNSRVAPNGDMEGFPNVIIEAMACELAIVSTYHAGIPMAITNEKEGLLVEEKNNEQLENAILRLIENAEESTLFAKNAKEKAFSNFSVEKMIEKYNEIYESV